PNRSQEYTEYEFAVIHNEHKLYFPENPGKPIVAKMETTVYEDWGQPALVWLDADANSIAEIPLNGLSTGVPSKDSIRYKEIFPRVDAVIKNSVSSKKLSYVLKDSLILSSKPAEAVFLAFRETVRTNKGWHITGSSGDPGLFASLSSGKTLQDILFVDALGREMLEITRPLYYEQTPLQDASYPDPSPVDTTDNYSGNYLVKQSKSDYQLYTLVPIDWLTSSNRDFPVIIDPTTNFYPGGTWPTYTAYRSGNSGTWGCTSGNYAGRANYYDISYGWVDDSWPTSNPYLDGYATLDISALQNNDCISSVTYYWYRYGGRTCDNAITLKFGRVEFNANLAEEPDCNVTGIRVRNNNSYYNGTGNNGTGWHNQAGNTSDFVSALPDDQITLGWAYNGGDDCCTFLCSGNDGDYHHVYGYEDATRKPYAEVTYDVASTDAAAALVSINPTCPGQSTTLTVSGGSLGTGADWEWYSGSCGGTSVGSGASIAVAPVTTTTYYVRAEGVCNTTGCVSVTVNVTN
ncbi:MAG: hypothetical protein QGH06_08890, partial [Lutibacter sp.]|nr:hypothetical protein [Lutibacter sp.]